MAQGKVVTNNLNLAQGAFPEIERSVLIIGVGTKNNGYVLPINTQSDLDDLLGVADSEIKSNVIAAKLNGGENWQVYAAPQPSGYVLQTVIDQAMAIMSPEIIAICTPLISGEEIDTLQAIAEVLRTQEARRVIIINATVGGPTGAETWAEYVTAQALITAGVAAYRVAVVPQLHGNDLGALVGRLCNRAVSIADSPMRVATGPMLGLGESGLDTEGKALTAAILTTLDSNRLSTIQSYVDYPGVYFGDCNLLDVPAGDYQVIENLRVVDKAARAIRILQISRISNRQLNSTAISIASNKTFFMRPLFEMSKGTNFAGTTFPGEIKIPKDGDIVIFWETKTKVVIYLKVTPLNSPKEIEANIILDLSSS